MVVVDVFIDDRRVPGGESGLETGNVIEDNAEDCQPIDQAIVRNTTECEELMNAGAEPAVVECVVEVWRNVKPGIAAKQGASNRAIAIDQLSEEELHRLHDRYLELSRGKSDQECRESTSIPFSRGPTPAP